MLGKYSNLACKDGEGYSTKQDYINVTDIQEKYVLVLCDRRLFVHVALSSFHTSNFFPAGMTPLGVRHWKGQEEEIEVTSLHSQRNW